MGLPEYRIGHRLLAVMDHERRKAVAGIGGPVVTFGSLFAHDHLGLAIAIGAVGLTLTGYGWWPRVDGSWTLAPWASTLLQPVRFRWPMTLGSETERERHEKIVEGQRWVIQNKNEGIQDLTRERDAFKQLAIDRMEELEKYQPPKALDISEDDTSREAVRRLQEVMEGAGNRAVSLGIEFADTVLLPALLDTEDDQLDTRATYHLNEYFRKHVITPCRAAFHTWQEESRASSVEAQEVFFGMYKSYQELRTMMERCRLIMGVDELGHLEAFPDWFTDDKAFREALREKLGRDDLSGLRKAIHQHKNSYRPVTFTLTP